MTTTIGVCNDIDGLLIGLTTFVIPVIIGLLDWFVMFEEDWIRALDASGYLRRVRDRDYASRMRKQGAVIPCWCCD